MDSTKNERIGLRVYVLLAFALVLWASAFAAIRVVVKDGGYSPGHLTFIRLAVAALTLGVYAFARGVRLPKREDMPMFLLLGASGIACYHTSLNFGERTVTAGSASFIVSLSPLFATVFAMHYTGERPRKRAWLGMAVAFAGATLIALGDSGGIQITRGAILILLAAASGGLFIAAQKPLLKRYSALEVSVWPMVIGALMTTVFAPGCVDAMRTAPAEATIAAVYLGVFPAAIAYFIWSHVLSKMPVSRAASSLYLVPALTVAISAVWPGEIPQMLSLVGGALALAGVIIANRR